MYAEFVNDGAPLTNWSIRLSERDVAAWDDKLYTLRKESARRLTRADVVRALMDLVDDPQVRAKLLRVLKLAA
jgi:hypothetical protein